jgi:hypothetical protein
VKAAVRSLAELGAELVLAPERHLASALAGEGVPLGELVVERSERAVPSDLARPLVLDTTHAKDGVLDVRGALRDGASGKSAKKVARPGDLVVSRLRPYLRQIALVHPRALAALETRAVALSTEFYVLAPRREGEDLGFLLPFLLGDRAQRALAAAQEGGHHPRVPRSSLFAIRVPRSLVRARRAGSARVSAALDAYYLASSRLAAELAPPP